MNNILNFLEKLGASFRSTLSGLGSGARLFFLTIIYSSDSFKRFNLTIKEIYFTGVLSMVIIVVSAFFVGMVLGLQGYYTLERYGSSEAIGVLVALALVRELGPVVTALLFAGRAGTAITAEIGLMKTTEQLSAMEMMAVSPIGRIVAPRFLAGMISMPILATVFSMVGILGGYFIAVLIIGVDEEYLFFDVLQITPSMSKQNIFFFITLLFFK